MLKVDATETEAYLAPCRMPAKSHGDVARTSLKAYSILTVNIYVRKVGTGAYHLVKPGICFICGYDTAGIRCMNT